jgi:8-oxo-dGTP diphosphatase
MLPSVDKAFAYITYYDQLLVFCHVDDPESGIQVPAGTIESGESPEQAVLREAREETGLEDFKLVRYLGKQVRDMTDYGKMECHCRYFYHLQYLITPPMLWRHEELNASDGKRYLFEFFWAKLPHEVPFLIADHGIMLPKLLKDLRKDT